MAAHAEPPRNGKTSRRDIPHAAERGADRARGDAQPNRRQMAPDAAAWRPGSTPGGGEPQPGPSGPGAPGPAFQEACSAEAEQQAVLERR